MTAARLIERKRDGRELSPREIDDLVAGYVRGDVPDYQMAAMAMAIFFQGMTAGETMALTRAMLASGQRLSHNGLRVDKHSTGGVGDKVSLVLAPLLAACGLTVPMISGRGLGLTGGTLDKLESIPGFRTDLPLEGIDRIAECVGCVITGTTPEIAPADRQLYALRDVTGTVPSIPLITASILSKKLAESLDALVLDVKVGSGAFMKTLKQGRHLAQSLVVTGQQMGLKTRALLTQMDQPLGRMAGNLVEVHESIAALQGRGPADLWECTSALAAELLIMTGCESTPEAALALLEQKIRTGEAFEKFAQMVAAQGGDLSRLPAANIAAEITAPDPGIVQRIDTEAIGHAIVELGGGRKVMSDAIVHGVGLETCVRVGDAVERRQPLLRVLGESPSQRIRDSLAAAVVIGEQPAKALPLILERIG